MYKRRIERIEGSNMRGQDLDLLIKFDVICRKLRESGKDLSKIKIVMAEGHKGSYVTKRIMEELKALEQ